MLELDRATLRLFNSLLVNDLQTTFNKDALRELVGYGVLPDQRISLSRERIDLLKGFGASQQKLNATFHASWQRVQTADILELILDQVIHYMTTYGVESVGLDSPVYVPVKDLDLPEGVPFVYVNGLTRAELLDRVFLLDQSGVALSEQNVQDMVTVLVYLNASLSAMSIGSLSNRELKTLLYDTYNIVPTDATEWLRYVVAKATGSALVVKDRKTVDALSKFNADKYLSGIDEKALATIFLRHKPLFLALKKGSKNKTFWNRVSRFSKTEHVAVGEPYLNTVTGLIANDEFDPDDLDYYLDKANVWQKIKLMYACNFRLNESADSIVYRVRNGKGYATEFNVCLTRKQRLLYKLVIEKCLRSISKGMNVAGKLVYIPENVLYPVPSSLKNYVGNVPAGTKISLTEDLIFGIHWDTYRDDFDLALISASGRKYGWNGSYRSANRDVLFSGDMTRAPEPNGATELFYTEHGLDDTMLVTVNHYNGYGETPHSVDVFVATEKCSSLPRGYMVDANKIVCQAKDVMISPARTVMIGVVSGTYFYFANAELESSIASSYTEHSLNALKYYAEKAQNSIDLEYLLTLAGATVVNERPEQEYIDLSPEALAADTIVKLLQ